MHTIEDNGFDLSDIAGNVRHLKHVDIRRF